MNSHSLSVLNFSSILQRCRALSVFASEEDAHFDLPFFYEAEALEREQGLVSAVKKCMEHSGHAVGELPHIASALRALSVEGSVLSIEDLENLCRVLLAYRDVLAWLRKESEYLSEASLERIHELIKNWEAPKNTLRILAPYFKPQFREEEIPELKKIIQRIQGINARLSELARRHLRNNKNIWSSSEASQRDGRLVLVIKSDFRSKVQGLVHGHSGSGQSLYIEPEDILKQNNELNEVRSQYFIVIQGILKKCSQALRAHLPFLYTMHEGMQRFDSLQARAALSLDMRAQPAHISAGNIKLLQARHPELGSAAVPIDIQISPPHKIILLSGPNTGGKTVAMKTLGLLSCMQQAGMELPCAEASELPLFSDILVDVGDEQSIHAGLSTFSAHLRNIGEILKAVQSTRSKLLVLIDELGTGTSPNEGSALALAILETLAQGSILAMVTTHLDTLKAYAHAHKAIENASVAFEDGSSEKNETYAKVHNTSTTDTSAQVKKYSIHLGFPGESHALDIAERVGIPKRILERAKEYMAEDSIRLQKLVSDLSKLKEDLQSDKNKLNRLLGEANNARKNIQQREHAVKERELELKEEQTRDHKNYIRKSRKHIEKLICELNESIEHRKNEALALQTAESNRRIRAEVEEIYAEQQAEAKRIHKAQLALQEKRRKQTLDPARLKPGVRVQCSGFSQVAQIIAAGRKNGYWTILAGHVKLSVHERDIEEILSES